MKYKIMYKPIMAGCWYFDPWETDDINEAREHKERYIEKNYPKDNVIIITIIE